MTILDEMKKPTEAQVLRRHRELWDAAIEEYGSATTVPGDVATQIGEEIRALHVLEYWDGTESPHALLRRYGVLSGIISMLAGEVSPQVKPERRKDKYDKLISLSRDNLYVEYTMDDLVKVSGLSASTVTTWAKSTGHFRSRERGKWEARDPMADRRAEQ